MLRSCLSSTKICTVLILLSRLAILVRAGPSLCVNSCHSCTQGKYRNGTCQRFVLLAHVSRPLVVVRVAQPHLRSCSSLLWTCSRRQQVVACTPLNVMTLCVRLGRLL